MQNKIELPEPDLYAHELIENGGGVWLGTNVKGICEQAYVEGETGTVVTEFYSAERVLDLIRAAVLAERADAAQAVRSERHRCFELAKLAISYAGDADWSRVDAVICLIEWPAAMAKEPGK